MRKAYEEYVSFNDVWITSIPITWQSHKMKHLFCERSEKGYPHEQLLVASQNMGVVPKTIYGSRTVEAQKDLQLLKLVKIGDFVISLRSFEGGIEYAYYQGIISPAYTVLTTKGNIQRGYFRYLAKSKPFVKLLSLCVTGIREGQNIDYGKLKNHLLPIPPREEQEQIVRFLDWKVSSINRLINLKQQEITQLKELKKATISDAVTHGLDKTVPMKDSGITWLGKIPQHWEMSFLSQVAAEKKVKKPRNAMFPVMSLSYGRIIKKKNINSGLVPNNYDNYQIISRGDIILRFTDLQNDHTSLRTGLVTEKGIITSAYTNIKPRTNSGFLAYLLHSYDELKIFYGLGGGVRQSIGFKDVRYLQLPIPPRDEQEKIACFLDARCAEIDRLIAANQAQITNLHDLKSSLIADVVTGQIDVRDVEIPDYEQVEETLYRSDANTTLQSEDEIPEEV